MTNIQIKIKVFAIFSITLLIASIKVVAQNVDLNEKEKEYYLKKYHTNSRITNSSKTIEYCLDNKIYNQKHLWIREESSYMKLLENAEKFKNIDSLTIGSLVLCDLLRQYSTRMFENKPADLPDFPKLSYLNVSVATLMDPFSKFSHLKNLKELVIIGQYDKIPEEIWLLKNLEKLHLTGEYTNISPNLANLTSLKELSLCGNWIDLPKTTISSLKFLELDGSFDHLPPLVLQNKNLLVLQLKSNLALSVGKEIAYLKNLILLDLSKNYIKFIHEDIGKLSKLEEIFFSCSWIESIPETICDLPNLKEFIIDNVCSEDEIIDLYAKDISLMPRFKVPKNIQKMTKLENFDLYNRKVSEEDLNRLLLVFGEKKVVHGDWE